MFNPLRALRERLETMTPLRHLRKDKSKDIVKPKAGRYIESDLVLAFEEYKEKQNEKENL